MRSFWDKRYFTNVERGRRGRKWSCTTSLVWRHITETFYQNLLRLLNIVMLCKMPDPFSCRFDLLSYFIIVCKAVTSLTAAVSDGFARLLPAWHRYEVNPLSHCIMMKETWKYMKPKLQVLTSATYHLPGTKNSILTVQRHPDWVN